MNLVGSMLLFWLNNVLLHCIGSGIVSSAFIVWEGWKGQQSDMVRGTHHIFEFAQSWHIWVWASEESILDVFGGLCCCVVLFWVLTLVSLFRVPVFFFFFWVSLMCFCILFIVTFLVTVFNFLVIYCFRLTVSVLCLSWLCSPLSPPVSTLPISLLYINSPAFPLSYSVCVFFLCVIFFFWFYYMWNIDIKYH